MPRTVLSYEIQDPTVSEIVSITFLRQSNGSGGFVTVSNSSYSLVDENDNVVLNGSVSSQLNGTQQAALASYINNHVIPAIIDQENL